MATLTVTATEDYSDGDPPLNDTTDIDFATAAFFTTAIFSAAQFDNVQISQTVHITGDANQSHILVFLPAAGAFSAEQWTFESWAQGSVTIIGSTGSDTIIAPSSATTIAGGDGADTLIGSDTAPDVFRYFAGTEIAPGESITGGSGLGDSIEVGIDGMTYDFSGADIGEVEAVVWNLGNPGDSATVILAGDQLGPGRIDEVIGFTTVAVTAKLIVVGSSVDLSPIAFVNWTDGDDSITINGTGGIDTLTGSERYDIVLGFAGSDTLTGGDGNDTLTGGTGKDTLTGDAGIDFFDFNKTTESRKGAARDVITDFNAADDVIDLVGIDAKTGVNGNQKFKFIKGQQFHDVKGELHFVKKAGFVLVEGDVNGDGRADFQIQVDSVASLVKADFIL